MSGSAPAAAPARPEHGLVIETVAGRTRLVLFEAGALVGYAEAPDAASEPDPLAFGALHRARVAARTRDGAFLELASGARAFLDAGRGGVPPEGTMIAVQITREPAFEKLAQATRKPTLKGRYLVFRPALSAKDGRGVELSRRLADADTRARLAALIAPHAKRGIWILRSAAANVRESLVAEEALHLAQGADALTTEGKPALLRPALDPARAALLDWPADHPPHMLVDHVGRETALQRLVDAAMPDLSGATILRTPAPFRALGIEDDLTDALGRVHPLADGAAVALDETPTLAAFDIDRGSSDAPSAEINRRAMAVIARLMRLRRVAGLVLIDPLRVEDGEARAGTRAALESALAFDAAGTDILGYSRAGLIEIMRRRTQRPLAEIVAQQ